MKLLLIFNLILCSTPALADLNTDQRGFLTHFLGLSAEEAKLKFEVKEDASLSHTSLFTGVTHPSNPRLITLSSQSNASGLEPSAIDQEGTLIHEAIHLYYYRSKPNEEKWVQEGIALLGEFLYDLEKFGKAKTFVSFSPLILSADNHLNGTIQNFEVNPESYGDSFLFFIFIYGSFQKEDFSQAHLRSQRISLAGIEESLRASKSASLTPIEWKSDTFLVKAFEEALAQLDNPLATSAHDLFQQCLSLRGNRNRGEKK